MNCSNILFMQIQYCFKISLVVRKLTMEFEPRPEFRPSLWGLLLCTGLQRASDVISTKADIMSIFLSLFSNQFHLYMWRSFQIKGFE